jgi:hypothetical protein
MRAFACARCGRCWLLVGEESDQDRPPCTCGGALAPSVLTPGHYELIAESEAAGPREFAAEPSETPNEEESKPAEQPADLGYGRSHGNPMGHEGPSGPGDAPAR